MGHLNGKDREIVLHVSTISRYTKVVAQLAKASLVEYGGESRVHGGIDMDDRLYTTTEKIRNHLDMVSAHANSKYLTAIDSSELYTLYAEAQHMLEEVTRHFRI